MGFVLKACIAERTSHSVRAVEAHTVVNVGDSISLQQALQSSCRLRDHEDAKIFHTISVDIGTHGELCCEGHSGQLHVNSSIQSCQRCSNPSSKMLQYCRSPWLSLTRLVHSRSVTLRINPCTF